MEISDVDLAEAAAFLTARLIVTDAQAHPWTYDPDPPGNHHQHARQLTEARRVVNQGEPDAMLHLDPWATPVSYPTATQKTR